MSIATTQLKEMHCGTCGIPFAMPQDVYDNKQREGGNFYCPNGCCRGWSENEADRLRKKLAERERELTQAKSDTLRATLEKGEAEKARVEAERKLKRSNKGVCTCCNRSFINLARHMKTKHPAVV